jgi:hypothetical protein
MIWCYDCKIDTNGTGGIFDGPIPWNAALLLLGKHCFDRFNMKTGRILKPMFINCKNGRRKIRMVFELMPTDDWECIQQQQYAERLGLSR